MSTQRHGARLSTTSCPAQPTAAVLVFHGGAADSTAPVSRFSPAVLRLIPVARAIARAEPSVAVYRLRFGVRGWNGLGTDVLADAHQALADIAVSNNCNAGPGTFNAQQVMHNLYGHIVSPRPRR